MNLNDRIVQLLNAGSTQEAVLETVRNEYGIWDEHLSEVTHRIAQIASRSYDVNAVSSPRIMEKK